MVCLTFIYLIILALVALGFIFHYTSKGNFPKLGGAILVFVVLTYLIVYIGGHYLSFNVPDDTLPFYLTGVGP